MRDQRRDDKYDPPRPRIKSGADLIGHLFEVGPVSPGGMGPVPLTFQEIEAWARMTGVRLTAWEVRTLRSLSREYLAELRAAESPGRIPPYSTTTNAQQQVDTAMALRRQMRGVVADD